MKKALKFVGKVLCCFCVMIVSFLINQSIVAFAEENSSYLDLIANTIRELFIGKQIENICLLYNFDDNDDFIYVEFIGDGYAVLDKETLTLLEFSEQGYLYNNLDAINYYGGPNNYYYKNDSSFVHTITGETHVFSSSEKTSMANTMSIKLKTIKQNKEVILEGQNIPTTYTLNSNTYDPQNPPIASAPGTTGVKYIQNYQFFTNYTMRGENIHGTCGSVAAQIILNYNNFYVDRRIIQPQYLNGGWQGNSTSDIFKSSNYTAPENDPNVCSDFTTLTSEKIGSNNSYYNYIIDTIEPSAKNCIETMVNGQIVHSHTGSNRIAVQQGIMSLLASQLDINTINIVGQTYSTTMSTTIVSNIIDEERPLIIGMDEELGGINHWVVCYGYQDLGSDFGYIVDYGWGIANSRSWIHSIWCDSYIDVEVSHEHDYTISKGGYYQEMRCGVCGHRKTNFLYEENNTGITILGIDGDLIGNILNIPDKINGLDVTKIGDGAFSLNQDMEGLGFVNAYNITQIGTAAFFGCSNLTMVRIPEGVLSLGDYAFSSLDIEGTFFTYEGDEDVSIGNYCFAGTNMLAPTKMPPAKTIGAWAFANIVTHNDLVLVTRDLTSIGEKAFLNTDIDTICLSNLVTTIGENAFLGSSELTIYSEFDSKPIGWASNWNSSNRPVVWGCQFDSTNSYVEIVNKTTNTISNNDAGGISYPMRLGYTFAGWFTSSNYSGTAYFDIEQAPTGMLYAKWENKASCVAEGTMVTLADGSQVAVENLIGNEELLVWNLNTGSFDSAPILFVDRDDQAYRQIIHLYFSDGTELKIVDEHALWCFDLNKYVYLDDNAIDYVGKYFNKKTATGYTSVQLIDVSIYREVVRTYSPVTSEHLCYYVNGLLSMPGGIGGMFNIYDVVATEMKYDQTAMQEDIATYGLFTYEEFCEELGEIPETAFVALGGEHLKVAMGKGLINREKILALIEQYQVFFI